MNWLKNLGAKVFRDLALIDLRSLAAFRIGLGAVVISDLIFKGADLTAFYTDQGFFPRTLAIKYLGWWSFSFHMASGAFWFQALLLMAGLALAFCVMVGYQTRLATFALWLFVVSMQGRNFLILHSGDALIRVMLFWAMFLPMDRAWSLDNQWSRKTEEKPGGIANLATFCILIQLLSMYFFTALLKHDPEWNVDFLAIYYALQLEQFTTSFGQFLGQQLALTKILTAATYYLELLGPLTLVIPWVSRWARWAVPFMFMGLHLGIGSTMHLGTFPAICIVCWLLYLPGGIWDLVPLRWPKLGERVLNLARKYLPRTARWQRSYWAGWAAQVLLLGGLVAMMSWNINTLPFRERPVPEWIRLYALPLRLDQYWVMFAPRPMRADGWFVADGVLRDGTRFDPWNHNFPPDWEKPDDFMKSYRSGEWRKYLYNIWIAEPDEDLQLAFGKYLCREWNDLGGAPGKDQELEKYELYYLNENSPPPGGVPVIQKRWLWQHYCYAAPVEPRSKTPPAVRD